MPEELISFDLKDHKSIIKVIGVGGGGCNAVNHMFKQGIKDVNFVVTNTDLQALNNSPVPLKVQLGTSLTDGRGAGNKPDKGRESAIETLDDIVKELSVDTKMVFITAGMGGGTGTGAAPIIAKAAKDLGVLTVAIVTIPFRFEGQRRINQAIDGITELSNHVDSLLVINNEKLREIFGDLKISDAFNHADNVLTIAAKGIAEIITIHGHLNVDFADVQTVMSDSGVALMGSAQASGEDRAMTAIQNALNSPLLNNNDIKGAKDILLNITSGSEEVTMDEIGMINDFVQEAAGYSADLIWGNTIDESLGDKICVTVIATGFKTDILPELAQKSSKKTVVNLDDKKPKKQNTRNDIFVLEDEEVQYTNRQEPSPREIFELENDLEQESQTTYSENKLQDFSLEENAKKAAERIANLKKTQESNKKNLYRKTSYNENIETLESIPAYKRKKILMGEDESSDETQVSRYTLADDDDEILLKTKNSYIHDRVD